MFLLNFRPLTSVFIMGNPWILPVNCLCYSIFSMVNDGIPTKKLVLDHSSSVETYHAHKSHSILQGKLILFHEMKNLVLWNYQSSQEVLNPNTEEVNAYPPPFLLLLLKFVGALSCFASFICNKKWRHRNSWKDYL